MSLKLIENGLDGVATLSEGETQPIWCKSQQAYYYVEENQQYDLTDFCNGIQVCEVNLDSMSRYFTEGLQIIKKYKALFKEEHYDRFIENKKYFHSQRKVEFYIVNQIGGGNVQNQLKIINKHDNRSINQGLVDELVENGERIRQSIIAGITNLKFKRENGNILLTLEIIDNWGDVLMKRNSKVNVEKLVSVFEQEVERLVNTGKSTVESAQIFGVRYQPLINNNNIDIAEIINGSKYSSNAAELIEAVKNGMKISPDIIWETHSVEKKNDSNDEEYEKFKKLLGWFVRQLEINNDYKEGEKKYSNPRTLTYKTLIEEWRYYNGFDLTCTLASGRAVGYDNSNYINYDWVNITPHFNKIEKKIESICVKTKPDNVETYVGDPYYIEELDLENDNEPTQKLKDLFDEYRDEVLKWKNKCLQKDSFDYNSTKSNATNKIFYGVPGCGKSYYIEHNILGKDKVTKEYKGAYKKDNIIRTTFYQDYSNTDFVGQILPKVVKNDTNEKDTVEYIFNPGPFTLALIRAISCPNEKVALIVEEINRGNAPAIFGDIFQLLDRDDDSISEYGITNVGILDYLNSFEFDVEGEKKCYTFNEIKIPGNMDIFATMNTSDQNVYTLDTAFTRRWSKERMPNDFNGNEIKDMLVPGMYKYTWKEFVDTINGRIQDKLDDLQVNEDKQVGAFFVKKADLLPKDATLDDIEKAKAFAYKVIEYLWDDVSKLDHSVIFNPSYNTFEKLVDGYVKNGVAVFNNGIFIIKSEENATKNAD